MDAERMDAWDIAAWDIDAWDVAAWDIDAGDMRVLDVAPAAHRGAAAVAVDFRAAWETVVVAIAPDASVAVVPAQDVTDTRVAAGARRSSAAGAG